MVINDQVQNLTHYLKYTDVSNEILFIKNAGTRVLVGIEEFFRTMLTVLDESAVRGNILLICDHYYSTIIGKRSRYTITYINTECDQIEIDCFITDMHSTGFKAYDIKTGTEHKIAYTSFVSAEGTDKYIETQLENKYIYFFTVKGFHNLLTHSFNKDANYIITTTDNLAHNIEKMAVKKTNTITAKGLSYPIESRKGTDCGIYRSCYEISLDKVVSITRADKTTNESVRYEITKNNNFVASLVQTKSLSLV